MSTDEIRILLLSECGNSWNYIESYLALHLSYLTLLYLTSYLTLPYVYNALPYVRW